jgi:hypothetical protein
VTRRYILRFQGPGDAPGDDVSRIERVVRVIERTPRMLLVEAAPGRVAGLVEGLPRWVASEERTVPVPDARPALHAPSVLPGT